MDAVGGLVRVIGDGIVGLVGGAFQLFGSVVQGVVRTLQSVLPGPWLPIVAIAVVLVVGWNLAKR